MSVYWIPILRQLRISSTWWERTLLTITLYRRKTFSATSLKPVQWLWVTILRIEWSSVHGLWNTQSVTSRLLMKRLALECFLTHSFLLTRKKLRTPFLRKRHLSKRLLERTKSRRDFLCQSRCLISLKFIILTTQLEETWSLPLVSQMKSVSSTWNTSKLSWSISGQPFAK